MADRFAAAAVDFLAKMPVKENERPQAVSAIRFGMLTGKEIVQASHFPIVSRQLYSLVGRKPVKWGVLDPRLGMAKDRDPVGRFAHIDLALPVFHIGFFKATIATLQCVCKRCSRVLLAEPARTKHARSMRSSTADALRKVKLRKAIIDACKKCRICPYCGAANGPIKRVAGAPSFRIAHDIHKVKSSVEADGPPLSELVAEAARLNPDLKPLTDKGAVEIITPLRALDILRAIPDADSDLLWVNGNMGRPQSLILTHMPVPPVCIRPSVAMDAGGGSNEDDLTVKLQEIVGINLALKAAIDNGAQPRALAECWDLLQVEVGAYINGELPGLPPAMRPRRPIRALCQRLKGKQGRFRGNLSGKRVDFSARTVISPDPNLPVHCVAVPELVAKILTFPERVTTTNIARMRALVLNGHDKHPGANYHAAASSDFRRSLQFADREQLAATLRVGDVVERHLQDDDVVLFNRQPSLHKMSIMAHRVRVQPWKTFRFNECVCSPYNADFDGDEMNMHLPQTEEARAEAGLLMDVRENLVTPRSGEPLVAACQDFITAAFLLTQRNVFLTEAQMMQAAAALSDGEEEIRMPPPAVLLPVRLWTGKQLFTLLLAPGVRAGAQAAEAMAVTLQLRARNYTGLRERTWPGAQRGRPDPWGSACPRVGEQWGALDPAEGWVVVRGGELLCGNLCKSSLGSNKKGLIHALVRDRDGHAAAAFLLRLTRLCTRWLSERGFSIGIEDVMPSEEVAGRKEEMVEQAYGRCRSDIELFMTGKLALQPGCNEDQSLEASLNGTLGRLRDTIGTMCVEELPFHNAPRVMAACGSKGSTLNICQMVACVGQQSVGGARIPNGFVSRTLPIFLPESRDPDAKGFVANSFFTGLTATEFFFHTMGGREGLVDTAVKTAETGYMQRRMMKALEDLSVCYDDTVRTSAGDIVQFRYGDDSLDPSRMMASGRPVEFEKLLVTQQVLDPCHAEPPLLPHEIEALVEAILESRDWQAMVRRTAVTVPRAHAAVFRADSAKASASTSVSASGMELVVSGGAVVFTQELRDFAAGLAETLREQRAALGLPPDADSPTSIPLPRDVVPSSASARRGRGRHTTRQLAHAVDRLPDSDRAAFLRGKAHAYVVSHSVSASTNSPLSDAELLFGEALLFSSFRVTRSQLQQFATNARHRFELAHIQPGEAVGAVAAHSMGEPATQMTLKTFHFAGVASMNVTLGVPRIKEIINASKTISTPILEAALVNNTSEVAARIVKGRIEKTTLGEVAMSITEVYTRGRASLEVCLDLEAIAALHLDIDADGVRKAIINAPKLKLKEQHVSVAGDNIISVVSPVTELTVKRTKAQAAAAELVTSPADMADEWRRGASHMALQELKGRLPEVIVCGIPSVSRAVITEDEKAGSKGDGKRRLHLLVEGQGLLQVMGTPGVDGLRSLSNHISEVEAVLGIEAARVMIMRELNKTYGSYGIDIDPRHLMLLADVMTYRGEVLGITRFGIAKMKDSVVMLASFEKTPDHLFDAAVHSREDDIRGVSECIVVGRPCGLGTGAFKLGIDLDGLGPAAPGRPSAALALSRAGAALRSTSSASAASAASSAAGSDQDDALPPQPSSRAPSWPLRSALRRRSASVSSEADFGGAASTAGPERTAPLQLFQLGSRVCSLLPRPPVPALAPHAGGVCPRQSEATADDARASLAAVVGALGVPSRAGLGLRTASSASSASSAAGAGDVPRRVALGELPSMQQRGRSSSSSAAGSAGVYTQEPHIPADVQVAAMGMPPAPASTDGASAAVSSAQSSAQAVVHGFGLPVLATDASLRASIAAAQASDAVKAAMQKQTKAAQAMAAEAAAAKRPDAGDKEEEDEPVEAGRRRHQRTSSRRRT